MFDAETEFQLLIRLGLVFVLGLLVGIERGWSLQRKKETQRTAGIRTFTLMAVSGGGYGEYFQRPLVMYCLVLHFLPLWLL